MECAKENKKSFFRKGGKSQGYYNQPQGQLQHQMQGQSQPRVQRSFDIMSSTPSSSSSSYGRAPAQSPSIGSLDFDSLSLASSASSKKTIQSLQSLQSLQMQSQNLQNLQNIQALQSLQNLHNLQNLQHQQQQQMLQQQQQQRPPAPQLPQKHAQKQQQLQHQLMGRVGPIPGNSGSLDEAEINMNAHRRYMPAPRRARSAERFDGMRIQHIQGAAGGVGSGELQQLNRMHPGEQEILSRSYRSPQILRQLENTSQPSSATGSPLNPLPPGMPGNMNGPVNVTQQPNAGGPGIRRPVPVVGVPPAVVAAALKQNLDSGFPIPSPPPSYTSAIKESRDPPPYHQAMAVAASMKHPLRTGGVKGIPNNRYVTMGAMNAHHNQSNSLSSTPTGNHQGMRTVASTPVFPVIEPSCSCHKCQVNGRGHDPYNDDAVYMESQAFLMHEIMTDGMAFCSIQ